MISITHIINPVRVKESSDLFKAQPITFETMRKAKEFAEDIVDVNLITTQFKEDRDIIPEFFDKTQDLERSVLDFGDFKVKRKLPLIQDILNRAIDYDSNADYIIYTNVDIALMPHFYEFVYQKIKEGFDAFVINRRTISDTHKSIDDLPLMFSDIGEIHPGYDCFVFKRDLYNKLNLENICIGAVSIGLALFINLKLNAKKFKEFGQEHLTFHIGNDQVWRGVENNPYADHNKKEFEMIIGGLSNNFNNINDVINSAFPNLVKENNNKTKFNWKTFLKRYLN